MTKKEILKAVPKEKMEEMAGKLSDIYSKVLTSNDRGYSPTEFSNDMFKIMSEIMTLVVNSILSPEKIAEMISKRPNTKEP